MFQIFSKKCHLIEISRRKRDVISKADFAYRGWSSQKKDWQLGNDWLALVNQSMRSEALFYLILSSEAAKSSRTSEILQLSPRCGETTGLAGLRVVWQCVATCAGEPFHCVDTKTYSVCSLVHGWHGFLLSLHPQVLRKSREGLWEALWLWKGPAVLSESDQLPGLKLRSCRALQSSAELQGLLKRKSSAGRSECTAGLATVQTLCLWDRHSHSPDSWALGRLS